MLYVYLDTRTIKLLLVKKTILGQYEVNFFEKNHTADLLDDGKLQNIDLLASALKEGLNSLGITVGTEKEVFLILPQASFYHLTLDVPSDIAESTIASYVADKARATIPTSLDNCFWDFISRKAEDKTKISFFAIEKMQAEMLQKSLELLNLRLTFILPDTLAIFKLFEKTLRDTKKESIFYIDYSNDRASGYVFDSYGLLVAKRWEESVVDKKALEMTLKEKAEQYAKDDVKLNRIILSGADSDGVRQDTFTKEVGVWTNPLKRIIPNFYEDYLKQLVVAADQTFPILSFDICFGAFVFAAENKKFNILKKRSGGFRPSFKSPRYLKEFFIFALSFGLSFGAFMLITRSNLLSNIGSIKSPINVKTIQKSPVPSATQNTKKSNPTPTTAPAFKKDELKIKVLNGSGTVGKATTVKEILSGKGYSEILTGNADNFDFEKTVIQSKKEKSQAAAAIKSDLKDYTASPKIETLDETETSDIIIIIGTDFK